MQLQTFYIFLEIHDARYLFQKESTIRYENEEQFGAEVQGFLDKEWSPIVWMIDFGKESELDWNHLDDLLDLEMRKDTP